MREIRKELWAEVLKITTDIVWGPDQEDAEATSADVERLHAVYTRQSALGQPDPFLTEALADFTDDAAEATVLYRLALTQNSDYPDEPIHTKRISMAARLMELGDIACAKVELTRGRIEAQRLGDDEYVALAGDLLSQIR